MIERAIEMFRRKNAAANESRIVRSIVTRSRLTPAEGRLFRLSGSYRYQTLSIGRVIRAIAIR